jgi:hypothetical protein
MDPYLEGDMWQEFHERLANQISMQLLPKLTPKYVALLSKRYVISRPSLSITDTALEKVIYPDVGLIRSRISEVATAPYAAVATPDAVVETMGEEVPVTWVEIRDVAERRLVTVIEILSPVNKTGDGYKDYCQRREMLAQTQTHMLELDLLRRGQRLPSSKPLPPAPYYAYLSRGPNRPQTAVYMLPLRERLKVLPVPLLPPDPDVTLDLQAAVDDCFALVGYERLLDYHLPPPEPAFNAEDQAWIEERLAAWRDRTGEQPAS